MTALLVIVKWMGISGLLAWLAVNTLVGYEVLVRKHRCDAPARLDQPTAAAEN